MVVTEVARAGSNRFGDGGRYGLESLYYWGRLWLLLGVTEPANQTAEAILAFPIRHLNRDWKVMVLELLFLGADGKGLDQQTRDYVVLTYKELWPASGYTPDTELETRQRIDNLFELSGVPFP